MVNYFEKNEACLAMIFMQLAYAGMALFSKAAIAKGMNPCVFVAYRQVFTTITLAPFSFFIDRFFFFNIFTLFKLVLHIF